MDRLMSPKEVCKDSEYANKIKKKNSVVMRQVL